MKRTLENKVAVVTGGSGAIGSAIIAGLEQQGACAVSLDVADPAAGAAPFQACDVRDNGSVASAIANMQHTYGRLDLVVHAAGVSRDAVLRRDARAIDQCWDALDLENTGWWRGWERKWSR